MESVLPRIAEIQKEIWIKRERKRRHKRLLTELLIDYAKNSTLHGLRYTTERSLTVFEKVFWILTFLISMVLCGYNIVKVYEKWDNSPVIVTVGERMVPAVTIPVPAITICPQIKCKARAYNFQQKFDNMKNLSPIEMEEFTDIRLLCGTRRKKNENYSRITNLTILDRINKVSPTIEDTLFPCINNVCDFTNTYTFEGLCFTYNNLASSEVFREGVVGTTESTRNSTGWSNENGYDPYVTKPYPIRSKLLQTEPHMEIGLHSDVADQDPLCNGMASGYKIYLSHPADVPHASVYYYAALNGQSTSLAINAKIFKSSKSLQKYPIEKRQCYMPNERHLRYFKIYTFSNCQMECLTNLSKTICGCYAFYMPRPSDENVTICGPTNSRCLIRAQRLMGEFETKHSDDPLNQICQCLPMCDNIQYEAEVLKTEYKKGEYLRNLTKYNNENDFQFSKHYRLLRKYNQTSTLFSSINVYFKQPYYVAMQRSELFGDTDFVANIGGLLGVFLGFSFLSLIEIFYFIFIRIAFTIKRDLKHEKDNLGN